MPILSNTQWISNTTKKARYDNSYVDGCSCTHQKNQFHPSFVALHVLPRPPCKIDIEYVTFKELYDKSQIWPPIIRFF